MSDTWNVIGTWNKDSFVPGDNIVGTISGADVHTTTVTTQQVVGPVDVPIVASDGAKTVISFPATHVDVTSTVTTNESVTIDTAAFVAVQGGRTWVVSADKLSISAVA